MILCLRVEGRGWWSGSHGILRARPNDAKIFSQTPETLLNAHKDHFLAVLSSVRRPVGETWRCTVGERGTKSPAVLGGGGCYYSVLHCVLPGLGLIQTLLCDGHNLLEDVTHVLLRLTQVVVFPYVVRIAQILLRQSNVTQHHVAVVLHRSKCATYCHMMGPGSFSNFQHLAKG